MTETRARIPGSLRAYVVDQRYERYTEEDQDVWRTVVGRMHTRLSETAHPAYARGLLHTGMRPDAIPHVEQMDRAMSAFGWGALCVDGFIPPRAFQAFQSMRVLPIACAVRAREHLDYTPAPDILHEAAGHAPLLVDKEYAAFVERISLMGTHTFSAPADREAFEAIRALSILKEDTEATAADVVRAEARVHASMQKQGPPSEAARLARLYWWTVEYGLVGTPARYKLYGAGLLSSVAESETCHDRRVTKHVLDKRCTEAAYDITRSQPMLFVARDFAHLHAVLDEVMTETAYMRGGAHALAVAEASGELAGLTFANGLRMDALVSGVWQDARVVRAALVDPVTRVAATLEGPEHALVLTREGTRTNVGELVSASPATSVRF